MTTLDIDDVEKLPRAKDEEGKMYPGVDYASDFFGKAAFLVRCELDTLFFGRVSSCDAYCCYCFFMFGHCNQRRCRASWEAKPMPVR